MDAVDKAINKLTTSELIELLETDMDGIEENVTRMSTGNLAHRKANIPFFIHTSKRVLKLLKRRLRRKNLYGEINK